MVEIVPREYNCGFCGAEFGSFKYIVTGPIANICNDCVGLCVKFIEDAEKERTATTENEKESGK